MSGNLGFSYVGLIFLFMLIVPNLIWAKKQPQESAPKNENKVLLCFERIGQALVIGCTLIFSNFNLQKWSGWSWWLLISVVILGIGHIGIHLGHHRESF